MPIKKGFTLIELMVVMVIIGILAAIAIPGYLTYVNQGYATDAANNLMIINNAQKNYYFTNGTICTSSSPASTACKNSTGDSICADSLTAINCNLSLNISTSNLYSYSCSPGTSGPNGQPGSLCIAALSPPPGTSWSAAIINDAFGTSFNPQCDDYNSGPYCPSAWTNCGTSVPSHSGYPVYAPKCS